MDCFCLLSVTELHFMGHSYNKENSEKLVLVHLLVEIINIFVTYLTVISVSQVM
jgi:hypothetical protein